MKIKAYVFKRKKGRGKGKFVVRIKYFDEVMGKMRNMERNCEKEHLALELKDKLIDELKKSRGQMQTGEKMTFLQLAEICRETIHQPAIIIQGRKIAGIKTYDTVQCHLVSLKKFFGERLIREITTENLIAYKIQRLKSNSVGLGRPIKITTVNRQLATMRTMMKFAYGKGWIPKDIFFNAKVIDISAEIPRDRFLTPEEGKRLLAACEGTRQITYIRKFKEVKATISQEKPLLRAMLIVAMDTAMRRGEIFKMTWKDIDFENNIIYVLAENTKTQQLRAVPLSQRAKDQLEKVRETSTGEHPFPYKEIRKSFNTAKETAGITNLTFHDLRGTAITRMQEQGTPQPFVSKIAGHARIQTTQKYYTTVPAPVMNTLKDGIDKYNSESGESDGVQNVEPVESSQLEIFFGEGGYIFEEGKPVREI